MVRRHSCSDTRVAVGTVALPPPVPSSTKPRGGGHATCVTTSRPPRTTCTLLFAVVVLLCGATDSGLRVASAAALPKARTAHNDVEMRALMAYNRAVQAERLGQRSEAVRLYEEVLADMPHLSDAHLNIGHLLCVTVNRYALPCVWVWCRQSARLRGLALLVGVWSVARAAPAEVLWRVGEVVSSLSCVGVVTWAWAWACVLPAACSRQREGMEHLHEAARLATAEGDAEVVASAWNNIGLAQQRKAGRDAALLAEAAVSYQKSLDALEAQGAAHYNLGRVFETLVRCVCAWFVLFCFVLLSMVCGVCDGARQVVVGWLVVSSAHRMHPPWYMWRDMVGPTG